MNKQTVWKMTPALAGLGSLLIYILACTSFSPDDSKVLYVTDDAKSGATGIAVYDRKSGKSELLFEPFTQDAASAAFKPSVVRPQWLEGGHNFLATWRVDLNDSDVPLNVAILPFDRRGPARVFAISGLSKDSVTQFCFWPLPVAGKYLFLMGLSNTIVRLDMVDGEMSRATNQPDLVLLPSPDDNLVFYILGGEQTNAPGECGLLDPDTFARKKLFSLADSKLSLLSMALSRNHKNFAYQIENGDPMEVRLLEPGKLPKILSLASLSQKMDVRVRQFSPKGDVLYASFKTADEGRTNCDYGFLEIPVDGSAVRKTVLIHNAPTGDKDLFASFQVDISHDGKTLAVESLWLAYADTPLAAQDCALFLVDLSKPAHKTTKIPIPLPQKERPTPFGK